MFSPERLFKMMALVLVVAWIGCGKGVGGRPAVSPSGAGQAQAFLGSVNAGGADFTVLPGSTVTNTGLIPATPDLGASVENAVTGFFTVDERSGTVRATTHQGCAAAAQAQADLTIAFDDAAAQPAIIAVSDIPGGQTLAAGFYEFTYSVEISSEDLALDVLTEADAALIRQIGSMLTLTPGRQIVLSSDGRASRHFCQIGSSATLGPSSVLQENLLPDQSMKPEKGTTLDDRTLAWIARAALSTHAAAPR